MKRRILFAIMGLLVWAPALGWAQENRHARLYEANQAYMEGRYEDAAAQYEELIHKGPVGGGVYFNLGNAYLKLNDVGRAILNYERAKVLTPRDPDLNFNLDLARDKRMDQAEKLPEFSPAVLLRHFSAMEIFWGFAGLNILFCLVITLRIWRPSEWNFYVVVALGILWITVCFFSLVKWHDTAHDSRAVVLDKRIDVRAGPGNGDTLLFQLHGGSLVDVERKEGDWRLVRFSPEKRGWTLSAGLSPIRPLRQGDRRTAED